MKHITDAYIQVHGECPNKDFEARGLWHHDKAVWTGAWACALAWKEEQEEMLEIEEDVLYQQEELRNV